jgi:hypothetical protein
MFCCPGFPLRFIRATAFMLQELLGFAEYAHPNLPDCRIFRILFFAALWETDIVWAIARSEIASLRSR